MKRRVIIGSLLLLAWIPTARATDCSGGTEIVSGGYRYHVFTNTGNDTLTVNAAGDVEVLVVAGGGGGGGGTYHAGGGGAGGLIYQAAYAVSGPSVSVTVGGGGAAGVSTGQGGSGTNSVFGSLTASGGGGGGNHYGSALAGGSGGGAGYNYPTPGTTNVWGQGNKGGTGVSAGPRYGSGGGGGAGGVGVDGTGEAGGDGGVGLEYPQFTGFGLGDFGDPEFPGWFAGGGGGSAYSTEPAGSGGKGGGGAGSIGNAASGDRNTGGGGGGAERSGTTGGAGGSGIVIVRYLAGIPQINTTNGPGGVTTSGAWLQATLTSTGAASTEVWCYWGTNDAGTVATNWANTNYFGTNSSAPPVAYSNKVTGLTSNTLYYYAYRAVNSYGTNWASQVFGTHGLPTVYNEAATGITANAAALNGSLALGGTAQATIYWGADDEGTSHSAWANTSVVGTVGVGGFSSSITFSSPGIYYYRCYVTNAYGEDWADTAELFASKGLVFVDASAAGANNGTSWIDAYASLQDALAQAGTNTVLWVAEGIYSPGTFQLCTNMALYGGFTSGMGALSARDWTEHLTVLRGGASVVKGADGARLDGFTVTGGTGPSGGGIFMSGGNMTVANCNVVSNHADWGGGIYLWQAQATIEKTRVVNNSAVYGGGGLVAFGPVAAPAGAIRNCVFIGNRSEGDPGGKSDGGGIYLYGCPYRIENCTLYNNFTGRRGGGIKLYGGASENYVIRNCILWNNRTSTADPDPLTSNGGWELAVQQDSATVALNLIMSYTDWTPVGKDKVYFYYRDGIDKHVFTELMEADPAFADVDAADLHIKSWAGRWKNNTWVYDTTNSPCIDAGDPFSAFHSETDDNGGRINMGAYGNTDQASRTGLPIPRGTILTIWGAYGSGS